MIDERERQEEVAREHEQEKIKARNRRAREARKAREQIMRDLGLVKVRGSQGGTYWE